MLGLSPVERKVFARLSTPKKIQDYLDALPINHEKQGETCLSPRGVLREQKAHCLEGALFAAVALWVHGHTPLVLNFKTKPYDQDHAVTLYKVNGYWGALSKTNHPVLRFRDPIYKSVRELALSYFHEYFMFGTGEKTLRFYSKPVNVRRFGTAWVTAEEDVWNIAYALASAPHLPMIPVANARHLRYATAFECRATDQIEWDSSDPRT